VFHLDECAIDDSSPTIDQRTVHARRIARVALSGVSIPSAAVSPPASWPSKVFGPRRLPRQRVERTTGSSGGGGQSVCRASRPGRVNVFLTRVSFNFARSSCRPPRSAPSSKILRIARARVGLTRGPFGSFGRGLATEHLLLHLRARTRDWPPT
jgi:hypothetical protein